MLVSRSPLQGGRKRSFAAGECISVDLAGSLAPQESCPFETIGHALAWAGSRGRSLTILLAIKAAQPLESRP